MVHLRTTVGAAPGAQAPMAYGGIPAGPVGMPGLPAPAVTSVSPPCPAIQARPPLPGVPLAPQPPCAHQGVAPIPATGTSTEASSMTASYAVAGTLAAVLLGAIGLKYRTHGDFSSFWGRVLALALAAAAGYQASASYTLYNENNCSSASADSSPSSGSGGESTNCPSSIDVIGLGAVLVFHLFINLPFLFAGKEREKKLYASFSLYQQATVTTGFSGAAAMGMHSMGSGLIAKAIAGAGCLVGGLFTMGYFKNEDGAMERLMENASAIAGKVSETAAAALNSGLQIFGLDAGERSKVSEANVYLHARVKTTPSGGQEGAEQSVLVGEVVGFATAKGGEGRPPRRGRGYANVQLDGGKGLRDFAIGGETGKKFELEFEDEGDQQGVVDKVMSNMFSAFGFSEDPNDDSKDDRKRQVECFFQQRQITTSNGPDDDPESLPSAAPKPSIVHLTLEAFDENLNAKATVSDGGSGTSKTAFKGAVRAKDVGKGVSAVVVELQKLPDEVQFLAFSVRMDAGKKLRHGAPTSLAASLRGFGKVMAELGNLEKKFADSGANEGFLFYVLAKKKLKGEVDPVWVAVEKHQTAFSPGYGSEAVASFVAKVKAKRDADGQAFVADNVNLIQKLIDLEIEYLAEQKAKEKIAEDIESLATKYAEVFVKQGKPPAAARVIAKKYAAVQFQKVQGARYQQILRARLPLYVRAGKQPQLALELAKKDALKAVTFGSRGQALLSEAREEILAKEEQIKDQKLKDKEAYKNSWTGYASGLIFGNSDQEEETKSGEKKKKKKKSSDN